MKEFVLSDESINSYGFKVLTKGINLKNFERNPVMYYNHDRSAGVIGKWRDIQMKDDKLFGVPVFDENDELGTKIAGKVKDGFIRAVSIGADNINMQEIGGELVVVSCDLLEVSICDIPSNKNALMLYIDDKPITNKDEILKLCKTKITMNTNLKPITDALGLDQNTNIEDIVSNIELLKDKESPKSIIENAIKRNLIAKDEKAELLQLASASPIAFKKYIGKRQEKMIQERQESGLKLTNEAIRDGRISCDSAGKVRAFWLKNFSENFDETKDVLNNIPKRQSISKMIEDAKNDKESRSNWTLADYRKKAPLELKNNPALYQQLLQQEEENKNN